MLPGSKGALQTGDQVLETAAQQRVLASLDRVRGSEKRLEGLNRQQWDLDPCDGATLGKGLVTAQAGPRSGWLTLEAPPFSCHRPFLSSQKFAKALMEMSCPYLGSCEPEQQK